MNRQLLCPIYKNRLYGNTSQARFHRTQLLIQAQKFCLNRDYQKACLVCANALEIARVVLLTPFAPFGEQTLVKEDYFAFVSVCMYLAGIQEKQGQPHDAATLVNDCKQQLQGLLPLHATEPQTCETIASLIHALEAHQYKGKEGVKYAPSLH